MQIDEPSRNGQNSLEKRKLRKLVRCSVSSYEAAEILDSEPHISDLHRHTRLPTGLVVQ